MAALIAATTLLSVSITWYVYDASGLYTLGWLKRVPLPVNPLVLNVTAGFDETSALLQQALQPSALTALDFYDAQRHIEISIKRARNAYPPFPGTVPCSTDRIPLPTESVQLVTALLAAHEIRNDAERIAFFEELHRVLTSNGSIVVLEHLRDVPNFIAYTIGFLHFHSRDTWRNTFRQSGFMVATEYSITPFLTAFILKKNGTST